MTTSLKPETAAQQIEREWQEYVVAWQSNHDDTRTYSAMERQYWRKALTSERGARIEAEEKVESLKSSIPSQCRECYQLRAEITEGLKGICQVFEKHGFPAK